MRTKLKRSVVGLLTGSVLILASSPTIAEGYMHHDRYAQTSAEQAPELSGWARLFFLQGTESGTRALEPEEQHYFQMNPGCVRTWEAGEKNLDSAAFQRCIWDRYQP
ncbi:MAG: hypothetical protein GWN84_02300 [Gammaproteobacteria bacterium]|nr:hypothetical protein [Gammaproteobacteria bacterium]NIR81979.1 hypothetical protein [Gammaproteobacteria bacterium]NIR89031.1 hypothetical protein [Gammaproteobacteria bacterium]NIU03086.1 hypothetical protein [Gammaproteobacteria bacterium]NIV50610.1 hypothetical protein [Gammaproteobacteria bacterium]